METFQWCLNYMSLNRNTRVISKFIYLLFIYYGGDNSRHTLRLSIHRFAWSWYSFSYRMNRSLLSIFYFPRWSLVVLQSSDGFCFHSVLIMLNEIPDIRLSGHRNQNYGSVNKQTDMQTHIKTRNLLVYGEIFTLRESDNVELHGGIRIGRFELFGIVTGNI